MEATHHEESTEHALDELERIAEEIRVKIHLASMDAKDTWSRKLEPRVFQLREHAKQAKESSREAVKELRDALRAFSGSL